MHGAKQVMQPPWFFLFFPFAALLYAILSTSGDDLATCDWRKPCRLSETTAAVRFLSGAMNVLQA